MRSTRNSNPQYTEENDSLSPEPRIRDMEGIELDQYIDLNIEPQIKAMSSQTYYNKFKKILMYEQQWREEIKFRKRVQTFVTSHWKVTPYKKLYYNLKKMHTAFTKGNITIRPLINYPNHIGVFATKDIQVNETIVGLEGLVSVKAFCSDSMVVLDRKLHRQVKKIYGNQTGLDGTLYFVNHSDSPNLSWIIPSKTNKYKRAVYKAKTIRPIKAGEQLFLDYGNGYFENDSKISDYY